MISRLSSNRLLLSALAKRNTSKNALQAGFTLVELLIVVIIIGILAALSLPGFLNQAEKAKDKSATSMSSSVSKECQLFLVEATAGDTMTPKTTANSNINLTEDSPCTGGVGGKWTSTVRSSGKTATIEVLSDGSIRKSGTIDGWADPA